MDRRGSVGSFTGQQLLSDRGLGALFGDEQPSSQVDRDGQATQEGQRDEADPDQRGPGDPHAPLAHHR